MSYLRYARFLAPLLVLLMAWPAAAQTTPKPAPLTHVEVHSLPVINAAAQPAFDPEKATRAYLARIKGKARAQSDAYFEGGYVLKLVDTVYALVVAAILLWGKLTAAMRNLATRLSRSRFFQVPIYVAQYIVVTTVLTFPLTLYEGFYREKAYGLLNQDFLAWFGDFATSIALLLVGAVIVLTLIYSVIRAAPRTWWIWGAGITIFFLGILLIISPVFIDPLFNHYEPLPESAVKHSIVALARANGIPAENVYEFDESRQSNRISANVSGALGTTRIAMTDNLLKLCTPGEIKAVLGHEMGHYVLNHDAFLLTGLGLVVLVMFAFANWAFGALVSVFGGNWDLRSIDDPAGFALLWAIASFALLVATPATNTVIRTAEAQADIFGLNAAREPDGFATAALKLANYRKLEPTPLEEFVFYDHPSGRSRILRAMTWKAWHLNDPDIKAGPVSPQ
jgi:STE24 endopeptidase